MTENNDLTWDKIGVKQEENEEDWSSLLELDNDSTIKNLRGFKEFFESKKMEKEGDEELFEIDKVPESILWEELNEKAFDEQSYRIKDLIPKQGFVVLASISGEKKTWIAMEMAKAITSGEDFLKEDRFKTEGANVLYINGENAESEIQRRGRQLGIRSNLQHFKFHLTNTDNINLNKDEGAIWLKAFIEFYKIEVVIIDTFIATAGGLKEDKSDEVRQFFNKFNVLKNQGVVLIWLMHMRKPTNFEGRVPKKEQLLGSQDKTASVEVLLMLSSQSGSDEINVYQRKNRLGVEIPAFKINMKDSFDEDGVKKTVLSYGGEIEETENKKEQAKDLILEILENGGKQTNQILGLTQKQVGSKNTRTALKELVSEKLIQTTRQGKQNYYSLNENSEEIQQNEVDQLKDDLDFFGSQ